MEANKDLKGKAKVDTSDEDAVLKMEGNKDWKGKGKVDTSDEDVEEHVSCPTSTFEEGNGSESKNPEKEPISSSDNPQENNPVDVDVDEAGVPDKVAESPVEDDGSEDDEKTKTRSYPCRYCSKRFPSAQALGGHQNSHKHEREFAKRQRVQQGFMPYNYNYINYGRLPNSLTLGPLRYPSYNPNFTLARPPLGYPYFIPSFPNLQYPRFGPLGLSSAMLFKGPQLPVYTGNNGNFNSMGIGGEGGMLGGLQGPYGYNRSVLDAVGMGKENGSSSTPGLNGNSSSPAADGFEAAGTSTSDLFRTLFGVSQGETSNVPDEDCGEGDGTVDLLSRIGVESNDGGGSNGETEVIDDDDAVDLLSKVGVKDPPNNEENNGDGSSPALD